MRAALIALVLLVGCHSHPMVCEYDHAAVNKRLDEIETKHFNNRKACFEVYSRMTSAERVLNYLTEDLLKREKSDK